MAARTTARPGARAAAATVSGADLKFVFLWAYGGWDPTIALAPLHDHARIVVDPASEPALAGDLAYTHADDRPSVDDFYARYHALLGPAASARLPFPPPPDAAAHRPLCSELLRALGGYT